jgi:hypothetical protein
MLIAQQYYIDHGSSLDSSILNGSIPIYLPDKHLAGPKEKVVAKWAASVNQAFKKVCPIVLIYFKVSIFHALFRATT